MPARKEKALTQLQTLDIFPQCFVTAHASSHEIDAPAHGSLSLLARNPERVS